MGAMSLRLPDELDEQLTREAEAEGRPKSEVARRALAEWLAEQDKKRLVAQMAAELKTIYSDPAYLKEMRQIQQDFDSDDSGLASIEAQERAQGIDPDEQWWD